jgi:hypothetical protein
MAAAVARMSRTRVKACISGSRTVRTAQPSSRAVPSQVFEQLVPLFVGQVGEESFSDRAHPCGVRPVRQRVAAQAEEIVVRNGEDLAQPVKDMRRGLLDGIVLEAAQVGRRDPGRSGRITGRELTDLACLPQDGPDRCRQRRTLVVDVVIYS